MRTSSIVTAAALGAALMFTASSASSASLAQSSHSILAPSQGITVVFPLCTETSGGGCLQPLSIDPNTTAASDGESAFDPFGFGSDTSDGIALDSKWVAVSTPGWVNIPGTNTYVVPSCDANGVCENGPVFEGVGHWSAPGFTLIGADLVLYNISEGNGLSDQIAIFNDANGVAQLTFNSSVPEPATWAMMLVGFGGLGALARRRARTATA